MVPTLMIMVLRVLSQMRELKDLTLPLMVKVVVGSHKDVTLLTGYSLVQITSEAILRLFGNLMLMVGWSVLISGHFDKVLLSWPS